MVMTNFGTKYDAARRELKNLKKKAKNYPLNEQEQELLKYCRHLLNK